MWKSLMLWILWLAGLAVMVIASAVLNAQFGIKDKGLGYIFENVLNVVGITMITFGIIYEKIRHFIQKDSQYAIFGSILFKRSQQYRPTIWAQFIIPFNEKRKCNAYKQKLIKKEHDLDKKTTSSKLLMWIKMTPEEQLKGTFKDDFLIKKQQFLLQNDEWIKKNINSLFVKYDEINYSVIFGGFLERKKTFQQNDFITKNKTTKIVIDNMPRILLSTGVFALISSLILQFDFSATFYYLAAVKIVVSFWSTYLAWVYAENYNQQVTLKDIAFRAGVAEEYNAFICREIEKKKEGECNGN
jgi:hypothetical protein